MAAKHNHLCCESSNANHQLLWQSCCSQQAGVLLWLLQLLARARCARTSSLCCCLGTVILQVPVDQHCCLPSLCHPVGRVGVYIHPPGTHALLCCALCDICAQGIYCQAATPLTGSLLLSAH
jgi:hypothetical protein